MEYSTLSARLETFEPPTKRSKAGWPHKQPSAEAIAQAGFYYKPQSTGSDNVMCYLCERQLDGWEEEDDPIQEHLKHSPECGWAMLMSIAQYGKYDTDNMEDPTGASITEARRGTFTIGWPHEPKRGWVCKTEKMVEAGWHFAPTKECEDWVSCAYCKLSLDGWERKDNPFEEHYKRAPDCIFFHFAGTTPPSKRPKAKKGRASRSSRSSKASARLSTQSNVSVQSEGLSMTNIPDLDESIDTSTTSILSTISTASTSTNKGKRKAGGRAKGSKVKKPKATKSTRGKKAEAEPELEADDNIEGIDLEPEIPQTSQPEPVEVEAAPEPEQRYEERLPSATPVPEPPIKHPAMPMPEREPSPAEPLPPSPSPRPKQKQMETVPETKHASPLPPPRSPSVNSQSDAENAPPSTLSPSSRPPLTIPTATGTPTQTLSKSQSISWTPVDIDLVFRSMPGDTHFAVAESFLQIDAPLDEGEKNMTVQQWIEHIAARAESELMLEGERVVGVFEKEGARAMTVLESVECI